MQLPSGYVAETHGAWSQADAFKSSQVNTAWAWEDLEDTYLFPMVTPKSLSRSWSRRVSIPRLSFAQRANLESEFGVNDAVNGEEKIPTAEANTVSKSEEIRVATSTTSSPIPIRAPAKSATHRYQRTRSRDAQLLADEEEFMYWSARQRYEQRFCVKENRAESEAQSTGDDETCECTECKSRRWRRRT